MQGISVFQRTGRSCWYIAYDCPTALRRVNRSSGFRIDDPRGKVQAYEEARRRSMSGTARSLRSGKESWSRWVLPWLEDRYRHRTRTLTSYRGAWKYLALFFHERGISTPGQVTYQAAVDFIHWREARPMKRGGTVSRNTALHNVKVLSRIMREAVRRGYCTANPCYRMGEEVTSDPVPEKPEFSDEQIATIRHALAKSRSLWMGPAFEIAIHQGCRLSACAIPWERIDFEREAITFHEKGSRGRTTIFTVPLHPDLKPYLQRLKADRGGTHTCTIEQHASRNFVRFLRSIGIEGYSFHCCRVTVITRMARAGVPIQQAMAYVHHSNSTIHKIYQRLGLADLSACSAAIRFGL